MPTERSKTPTSASPRNATDARVGKLRHLAGEIDAAQHEIDLARGQCGESVHISPRLRDAAIKAARAIIAAADDDLWPHVSQAAALLGARSDRQSLRLWKLSIAPMLRQRQAAPYGSAGQLDFAMPKRDEAGRLLGRDGKPLEVIITHSDATGKPIGGHLSGEPALVVDDYDAEDALTHARRQAAEWSGLCTAAADAVRAEAARLEAASAAQNSGVAQSQQVVLEKHYLFGWTEILSALELKDDAEMRNRIRRLNDHRGGPIIITARGSKPKTERTALLTWWNNLDAQFQSENRVRDAAATVVDKHNHGREGIVVPGIRGSVKRRRTG